MTATSPRLPSLRVSTILATVSPAVDACRDLKAPTEPSIAAASPSGTPSVADNFVTEGGDRADTLNHRGPSGGISKAPAR
jgi:hypothetical protein